jgi:K+-transporting ATPase ATPase B chain
LTTFSIANDVAKYFAIIPALFAAVYPGLDKLNIMGLSSPDSAILSAVVFNALIIIALVPLSLKGVRYRPVSADKMLRRNLTVYGLGGLIAPFPLVVTGIAQGLFKDKASGSEASSPAPPTAPRTTKSSSSG